jgi:hypothetical protein
MNRLFTFCCILFFTRVLFAQDSLKVSKPHSSDLSRCGHNFTYGFGYNYSQFHSVEIMLGRSYSAKWNALLIETFRQYQIGLDLVDYERKFIIVPKLSYEFSFLKYINIIRANLLYVASSNTFLYRHEIGFTYKGYISLDYNYTFSLNNTLYKNTGHGFSIRSTLPFTKRNYDRIY